MTVELPRCVDITTPSTFNRAGPIPGGTKLIHPDVSEFRINQPHLEC